MKRVYNSPSSWADSWRKVSQLILEWKNDPHEDISCWGAYEPAGLADTNGQGERGSLDSQGLPMRNHFGNSSLRICKTHVMRGLVTYQPFSWKPCPIGLKFQKSCVLFCLLLERSLANPRLLRFSSVLSYEDFIVLVLKWRSVIYSEFIFVCVLYAGFM